MYIFKPILDKNWEKCAISDAKRIASQTEPEGLIQILDIPYINDGTKEHLLDIYYPEGTTEKLPVIIDIHGGGWMYGYKEINKYFNMRLALKGFLVASINYRLAGNVLFDDQIRDIFSALHWLCENLAKYPADTGNVFLAGDSAGGHFACVTAAVNLNESYGKDFGVTYCGLDFRGVAAICPAVDLLSGNFLMKVNVPILLGSKHRKSPYRKYLDVSNIISSDFPPFYINTARNDFIKEQAYKLKTMCEVNSVECVFHDFDTETVDGKYLGHVFNVVNPFSEPGDKANKEIAEFFKAHIK